MEASEGMWCFGANVMAAPAEDVDSLYVVPNTAAKPQSESPMPARGKAHLPQPARGIERQTVPEAALFRRFPAPS